MLYVESAFAICVLQDMSDKLSKNENGTQDGTDRPFAIHILLVTD